MASNDPNDANRSPERVGVYSTSGSATGGTTGATGTTTASPSTTQTHTATRGMDSDTVHSTSGGASSATRWLIPALIVALIILALLWWL